MERRLIERELGQIKYHLNKQGTNMDDIRIKWDSNQVEIKKEKKWRQVAWIDDKGQMQYEAEAEKVKEEVKQYMKVFKENRDIDDDEDL